MRASLIQVGTLAVGALLRRAFAAFALLSLAACASTATPPAAVHSAAPRTPLILIGLDALRWDILDRYPTPRLHELAAHGVRSEGLIPVMPSKTFPNFYAIATGDYPDHSGVFDNDMYDRSLNAFFGMRDAQDPRWWRGEPIWVTAEKQGVKAATYFWVGSEAPVEGVRPSYWKPYDKTVPYDTRVRQTLDWLDLPADQRPALIALYFDAIDSASHAHGVGSPEERDAVAEIDATVGAILDGVAARGLKDKVNIIVVGDHGMTDLSPKRVIYLDDYFDIDKLTSPQLARGRGNAVTVSFTGDPATIEAAYKAFAFAHPAMRAYRRGHLPPDYRLTDADRGPDLFLVPEPGWLLSRRSVPFSKTYLATHGYDPRERDMNATFIAEGPAFREGAVVEAFENVNLYPLFAHVLDLKPAKTDGDLAKVEDVLKESATN
jgi:alkaline phosphatase D